MTNPPSAALIQDVVSQVLSRLQQSGAGAGHATSGPADGIHRSVDEAVFAAEAAQQKLAQVGLGMRDAACKIVARVAGENAEAWGRFELEETKVGRLDHKIAKLHLLASVPGVEYLKDNLVAHSGDDGVTFDEAAPFGVIGVITPVTHSIPTMAANAINMIASGNTLVINAHPSGAESIVLAVRAFNAAFQKELGLPALLHVLHPPTLETARALFAHPRVPLLVVTGGPAVAKEALAQPKRAIVAGPGNPPVVVDETADLDRAAKSIVAGAAFDNNLLCIGEKQVFVVDSVADRLAEAFGRHGGVMLDASAIARLSDRAFKQQDGKTYVNKDLVGKDAAVLAQAAGVNAPAADLLFGFTDADHPFVQKEQMMPFVPLVRVRDFEEALTQALRSEHGYRHTGVIHSNDLGRITRMGKAMGTTIFVANGPSTAGLGLGGEGYPSYSIATPTGEGITTPLTFTRFRRACVAGALHMV